MPIGITTPSDLIDRVSSVKKQHPEYTSQKIADICNTSSSTVSRIIRGDIRKQRPLTFPYKDQDGILNFDSPREVSENKDELPKENIRHQLDKLDKKLHRIMSELGIKDMEDGPRE